MYLCKWVTKNSAAPCSNDQLWDWFVLSREYWRVSEQTPANQNAQDWPRIWSNASDDYNWPNFSSGWCSLSLPIFVFMWQALLTRLAQFFFRVILTTEKKKKQKTKKKTFKPSFFFFFFFFLSFLFSFLFFFFFFFAAKNKIWTPEALLKILEQKLICFQYFTAKTRLRFSRESSAQQTVYF